MIQHVEEVQKGQRFEFGKNWQAFLSTLDDQRIQNAENSLRAMLQVDTLEEKKFLDIGSGSGLFSLVARRLGAEVTSFDYDPQSVACTRELKSRYFPEDMQWAITQGSVLNVEFLHSLGRHDIVYSWGVLHHTGEMWQALENVAALVQEGGTLFIALYNDQGTKSKFWWKVKKAYCSGWPARLFVCGIFLPCYFFTACLACLRYRQNLFLEYKKHRGMSVFYDWLDWLGGLPFEVAKVEDIFEFYTARGFRLKKLKTVNTYGNNQFVFSRYTSEPLSQLG